MEQDIDFLIDESFKGAPDEIVGGVKNLYFHGHVLVFKLYPQYRRPFYGGQILVTKKRSTSSQIRHRELMGGQSSQHFAS